MALRTAAVAARVKVSAALRAIPRPAPPKASAARRLPAWAPAALGGAALGLVLLVFGFAIWRISAASGLIVAPERVEVAPARVTERADPEPPPAPDAAVPPLAPDVAVPPPAEPVDVFDAAWLRGPVARPARFMRRLEATPGDLCGRLRQLGLPDAPVTPGPLPTSPGWYCLAYRSLGDAGSSLIVTLRGARPGAVEVLRLKLNVLGAADDREVTRTATEAFEGLHATLGWPAPAAVLRAIQAKANLRLEEHGVRYELLREQGPEVRLNVLVTFYDDGAILDATRFGIAPPWR